MRPSPDEHVGESDGQDALWGVIVGAYILLMAVMPDLRGAGGLRRRALAAALFWTSTIVALFELWRNGF